MKSAIFSPLPPMKSPAQVQARRHAKVRRSYFRMAVAEHRDAFGVSPDWESLRLMYQEAAKLSAHYKL